MTSMSFDELLPPIFIGLMGVALVATVVLGLTRYRYSPRPRSPDA